MIETMITSSVLIAVIIGIRYLFSGKISCRLQYALWGLVLLRLCLPVAIFSSPISIMNVVSKDVIQYEVGTIQTGVDQENTQEQSPTEYVAKTREGNAIEHTLKISQRTSMILGDVLKKVWIIGSIAVGMWFAWANLKFYLQLRNSRKLYDKTECKLPVYLTEGIASPCLFGILRPVIYLTPKAIESPETLRYVIAHELCHFHHGDYIWSVMRGICLAIYWWNPLIWVAAILSRTDSEFACDEAVIAQIGENNRFVYGRTIIDMIAVKKAPIGLMCVATAMTSGKRGIKQRLNLIIRNHKTFLPAFMAVLIIAIVCVGCTFTGAQGNDNKTNDNKANDNKTNEVRADISDYAKELYDSHNPYIGDAPANGALMTALKMPENLDSYTLELETKEEPYILRLIFTNEVTVTDSIALDSAMNENAMLLLALIDNVSEIQWRYTYLDQTVEGKGIFTGSMTMEDASAALNETDIKSYGQSAEKVQELLDWLE